MRRWAGMIMVFAGGAIAGGASTDDFAREIVRPKFGTADAVLEELDPTVAAAKAVAALAIEAPVCDPAIDFLDGIASNVKPSLGKALRTAMARSLTKFVAKATESAPNDPDATLARLDARFFALRARRANGDKLTADAGLAIAEQYASGGNTAEPLARAVRLLRWTQSLPGADAAALKKREDELAATGRAIDPKLVPFRINAWARRLEAAAGTKKKLTALLEEVGQLARAKGASVDVLRFFCRVVAVARASKMKVAFIGEERTVHRRVSVTIPRNPDWRWGDGAMANTIALRHYALDGAMQATMVFSTMKGMSAKDAAQFAFANFQAELSKPRVRKPKKKRLNRKLKSVIQFEVRGLDPIGSNAVIRGYVWNVGSKKAGRLIMLTTRNPPGPMDAETEFVLDQLRNTE